MSSWAVDFVCGQSLEDLRAALDAAGPWAWQLRDSSWYGDYLAARPAPGLRVRVHRYPQTGEGGTFVGPGVREAGFTALLETDTPAARAAAERVLRGLLDRVGAAEVIEIEPYD